MKRARLAWLVVLLFPILLNSAELLNVFKADPVLRFSGLTAALEPGPLAIHASFDPSIGSVFQPLGRRAADELLHGRLPWWNPDQGIGAPLAGEMSPAALYPFILLEALPNGQTILDVFVQLMAGAFTFMLARRLKLGLFAAGVAAVLFETNGTFAWLSAGWCYPLPFLPLLLYGIELTVGPVRRERALGTVLVAVAVGVSISAGMIEVAYLDGLLAVAWALVRIAQTRAIAGVLRLVTGGVLGVMLALPVLIAFADYLSVANAGVHAGQPGNYGYGIVVLAQVVLPYALGPIFYHDSGYAGVALLVFGICGLFGGHLRALRLMLAAWATVAIGASSGIVIFNRILLAIPGVNYTAFGRYLDGSWELALALLAAFFVYDLRTGAGRLQTRYAVATATAIAAVCLGVLGGLASVSDALARPGYVTWCLVSAGWAALVIGVMWWTARSGLAMRKRVLIVAATVIFEASVNYLVPTLGYPRHVALAEGSIAFLRSHLGLQRYMSFGPLFPNYGSYYGIAALNDLELPVATSWVDYVSKHLDRNATPGVFLGQSFPQFVQNIDSYEGAATKYAVFRKQNVPDFQAAFRTSSTHLSPVYGDDQFVIYELPHPAPYFSAPGCELVGEGRERVSAQCTQPSVLVRRELFLPGWSARVNGTAETVTATEEVYQAVPLATGPSSIVFSFVPPFMQYGYAAFALGLLALAYQLWEYFSSDVRIRRS